MASCCRILHDTLPGPGRFGWGEGRVQPGCLWLAAMCHSYSQRMSHKQPHRCSLGNVHRQTTFHFRRSSES